MKAKTLLIAAAALAAGVMTSHAQVYSQNIVGYINVPLTPGYNLIANQLDVDGTGTNNSIYTAVGTNLPNGTIVQAWNGAGYSSTKFAAASGKWNVNNSVITNAMNPGVGFFIQIPGAVGTNVTFVGNVITGTNVYPVVPGFQIISSSGPVAGGITTVNNYHANKNDIVEVWNGAGYTSHKWSGTAWGAGEPVLNVGQSVFLDAAAATNWTQILNVQ